MNAGRIEQSDSSAITLWSITRNGHEARCLVERGTLLCLLDGEISSSHHFSGTDELIALTSDWRLALEVQGMGDR